MRRDMVRAGIVAVAGVLWLVVLGVSPVQAQERRERPRPERGEPARTEQADSAPRPQRPPPRLAPAVRLEVTVFHVEMARERIVDLDAKSLTAQGATPAKLAHVLEQFGPTEVRFRVDQPFAAGHDTHALAELVRDVPYAAGIVQTKGGPAPAAVNREHIGCKLVVQGFFPEEAEPQMLQATVTIETSAVTDSKVEVGPDVTAPVFWKMRQTYTGATELGKPVILVSADAGTTTTSERIVAMVSIVTMSEVGK